MHWFKRITIFSFFIVFIPFVALGAQEDTSDYDSLGAEKINDYQVNLEVGTEGVLHVQEIIEYDFGAFEHHGIYRDIPVKYRARGGNYEVRLTVKDVTDPLNNKYIYTTSREGKNLRIKIGDPNEMISGIHTYKITYDIERAINFFDDHDELYWNVTGNEWPVYIDNVSAHVVLPEDISSSDIDISCFTGATGSEEQDCLGTVKDSEADFLTENVLYMNEGLTIVVGWPVGFIQRPNLWQKILWILADNWSFLVPIISFIVLFVLWYRNGRDAAKSFTVIAQYEPPHGLNPVEVGTILDFRVDKKDVTGMLLDLAVRGYIKIRYIEKKGFLGKEDFELIRVGNGTDLVKPYEQKLFESLFSKNQFTSRKLSDLKNKFYKDEQTISKEVYDNLTKQGYFVKNPDSQRWSYLIAAILLFFIGFILLAATFEYNAFIGVSLGLTGCLFFIFSFIMPARTKKGVLAREHCLGYKQYLSVAEKDRIAFHNAPKKSPKEFERGLPYAIVFGVEKEWAQSFQDIYKTQPSWYEGNMNNFSAVLLAHSLGTFSTHMNGAMHSPSSGASGGRSGFGGGGFSGGGFGGGGGGSW